MDQTICVYSANNDSLRLFKLRYVWHTFVLHDSQKIENTLKFWLIYYFSIIIDNRFCNESLFYF